jgi:ATP-binding protein involved in chromosome partitioning
MRKIRTYNQVDPAAGRELLDQVLSQHKRLAERLASVDSVVAVMSGKGGVGKSALTANLAAALAHQGLRVGALDADLNGPSLARMLGASRGRLVDRSDGVEPADGAAGVKVVSMELFQADEDAPLRWKSSAGHGFVWQSAAETGALREFLSDVIWGELDFLLVDVPPGVDKVSRLLDLLTPRRTLLVSTTSEMSRRIVARSARFAREAGLPNVSLVVNMSEHVCGACGHHSPLYAVDGAEALARDTGLDVWARIPFEASLAESTDGGVPWVLASPESAASVAIRQLAERLAAERRAPDARPAETLPEHAQVMGDTGTKSVARRSTGEDAQ